MVRGCKQHEHEEVKGGLLPRLASGHASNGLHLLGLCRSYPRAVCLLGANRVFREKMGRTSRSYNSLVLGVSMPGSRADLKEHRMAIIHWRHRETPHWQRLIPKA